MNDMILAHHGVDGQEWGKRKYQYEDGSLTPLGRIHYGVGEAREKAKIKMREEKARAKNEIRIAKAKGKSEVAKIKAQAKAYKMKSEADSRNEREQIKADKEIEEQRINAQRESERNISKENREIAKRDAKTQVELAEIANEGKEEKKMSNAGKVALGVLAAAGVGFLLYKAVTSDGKVSGVSDSAKTKGENIVKENKDTSVKDITEKAKKTREKVNYSFNEKGDYLKTKSRGKLFDALFGPVTSKTVTRSEANKKEQKKIQKEYASNQKKRAEEKAANKGKWKENAANAAKGAFDSILKRYRIRQSDDNDMILIHSEDVCHWGILGMKWGVRRYQNEDGTLTELGKQHYGRALENARGSAAGSSKVLDTMTENAVKSASNTLGSNTINGILSGIAGGFTTGSLVGAAAGLGVATFLAITNKIRQHRAEKIQRILEENKQKVLTDFIENQSKNTEDYKEFKDSKEFRSIGGQYETEEEAFNAFKEHKKIAKNREKQEARDALENENLDLIDEGAYFHNPSRADKAAELGIKALIKRNDKSYGDLDPNDKDTREWFIEEDGTIGLGTIADMVNQGKSKQYIQNVITKSMQAEYSYDEDGNKTGINALSWCGYDPKKKDSDPISKFIDACIEIREEESKVKHSEEDTYMGKKILLHSAMNDGKVICHYGVKGQKWGVINEKEDYNAHGRTQNVTGSTSGATRRGNGLSNKNNREAEEAANMTKDMYKKALKTEVLNRFKNDESPAELDKTYNNLKKDLASSYKDAKKEYPNGYVFKFKDNTTMSIDEIFGEINSIVDEYYKTKSKELSKAVRNKPHYINGVDKVNTNSGKKVKDLIKENKNTLPKKSISDLKISKVKQKTSKKPNLKVTKIKR